jgi:uncharacterized protein YegP (UPF0339 family)
MKIEIYRDRKREWRWRIKARNGRIVGASSEGFNRRGKAQKNLWLISKALSGSFFVKVVNDHLSPL